MKLINIQRVLTVLAFLLSGLFMFYYVYYDLIYSKEVLSFLGYGPGGLIIELPSWFSWLLYLGFSISYISIFFNFLKIKYLFLFLVIINLSIVFLASSAAYTSLDLFLGNVIYMCDGVLLFTLFYKIEKD